MFIFDQVCIYVRTVGQVSEIIICNQFLHFYSLGRKSKFFSYQLSAIKLRAFCVPLLFCVDTSMLIIDDTDYNYS